MNEKYFHKTNRYIEITFDNRWYKNALWIEKGYSSIFESYALYYFSSDSESPIIKVYEDEKVLDEIIEKSIIEDIIDFSKYFKEDIEEYL